MDFLKGWSEPIYAATRIVVGFLFLCHGLQKVYMIATGAEVPMPAPVLWTAALLVDYGAPLVLYWVPGMRRLPSSTWEVETAHFAERFQLFVIIALGESIVITGATTAGLELTAARLAAAVRGWSPLSGEFGFANRE